MALPATTARAVGATGAGTRTDQRETDAFAAVDAAGSTRRLERVGRQLIEQTPTGELPWAIVGELWRAMACDLAVYLIAAPSCAHGASCVLTTCNRKLVVAACLGNESPAFPSVEIPPGSPTFVDLANDGHAQQTVVAIDDSALPPEWAGEGVRSVRLCAVVSGDRVHGALVAARRSVRPWSDGDDHQLRQLALFAGIAVGVGARRGRATNEAVRHERRRIAKELHDTVGQLLFGVGVAARQARESASTGRADLVGRMHELEQSVARANGALRHALRSLDTTDCGQGALPVSIAEEVEAFRHRSGVATQLLILGEPVPAPGENELLLVQITSEALRNVERHSHARNAIVSLSYEDGIVGVAVQDDGDGVGSGEIPSTGLGISGLREDCVVRNGELVLASSEDGGAVLRAWLPVA